MVVLQGARGGCGREIGREAVSGYRSHRTVTDQLPGICQQAPGPSPSWNARAVTEGRGLPSHCPPVTAPCISKETSGEGLLKAESRGTAVVLPGQIRGTPQNEGFGRRELSRAFGADGVGRPWPGCPASTRPRRASCPGGLGSAPGSGPLLAPRRQAGPHSSRSQAEPRRSGHQLKRERGALLQARGALKVRRTDQGQRSGHGLDNEGWPLGTTKSPLG